MSKTAFLFPGQGAQTVGMGKQLVQRLPAAREIYERASDRLGYDLGRLCFEGPAEDLDSTVYSQPAIYVTSLAALEVLKHDSPDVVAACQATAGLSLGEYTAMVFAGAMDFDTALTVVQKRGEAMQEASDATCSGMVSVLGLERPEIQTICDQVTQGADFAQVSNLLCPGNVVVSGTKEACEQVADLALAAGAMKVVPLAVAGAFHTRLMQSAVERLRAALTEATISVPRIPIVSNVDGTYHTEPATIRALLIKQIVQPVRWEESMRRLLSDGFDVFYEVGPGRVLRSLLRRIDRAVSCHNVTA